MLIKLANNSWVRKSAITSITPQEKGEISPARVIVRHGSFVEVVECPSFDEAKSMADYLADEVNRNDVDDPEYIKQLKMLTSLETAV